MLNDEIKKFSSVFEGLSKYDRKTPGWENDIKELIESYSLNEGGFFELIAKTTDNIKQNLYALNSQSSQVAFIKEILVVFYPYEQLLNNEENSKIIGLCRTIGKRFDTYLESAQDYYRYLFTVKSLYDSFVYMLTELCFLFGIDYDNVLNEYLKRYTLTDPIIVDWENMSIQNNDTPPPKSDEPLTFVGLFHADYRTDKKITELKQLLESNGYTKNGMWVGITGKKNELAHLYHLLKSKRGIILSGEFKHQIIVFYHEFGLTVKDKLDKDIYTVVKNLKRCSEYLDTYKDFERLFTNWVK